MKQCLLLVIALTVTGCATVPYNGSVKKIELSSIPEIGVVATVNIGDDLLAKATVTTEDVLVVHDAVDGIAYNIPPSRYRQIGYDSEKQFYSNRGITWNPFADPPQALAIPLIAGEEKEICVISVFGTSSCYEANYSIDSEVSREGNSFRQALIFSGRIGKKIKIGYREFSTDLSKPAFNNDVTYELPDSKILSYKGAQIEVIDIEDTAITYRVLATFN